MRYSSRLLLTFALCIWLGGEAESSIVYSNLGPGDTYNVNQGATICNNVAVCFAADEDFAVGFMPSATYRLDSIRLPVSYFAGANMLDVFLETNSSCSVQCGTWGGVPSDTIIEAFHFTNAMGPFGSANPLLVATSALHPILQANTLYWVVADGVDGSGLGAAWNDAFPLNSGPAAQIGGISPPTWVGVVFQGALKVTGVPVPEPTPLTLLGFGLASVIVLHRKKARRLSAIPRK